MAPPLPSQPHLVFNVAYGGVARELATAAIIADPLTGKTLTLQRVIWDTGATNSVLRNDIPAKLGLTATGQAEVSTANGKAIVDAYLIELRLPHGLAIQGMNVTRGDLGPNTEMLVGMDVIGLGDFIVQNCAGKTQFSFCFPPFANKLDMIGKANTINAHIAKQAARLK